MQTILGFTWDLLELQSREGCSIQITNEKGGGPILSVMFLCYHVDCVFILLETFFFLFSIFSSAPLS